MFHYKCKCKCKCVYSYLLSYNCTFIMSMSIVYVKCHFSNIWCFFLAWSHTSFPPQRPHKHTHTIFLQRDIVQRRQFYIMCQSRACFKSFNRWRSVHWLKYTPRWNNIIFHNISNYPHLTGSFHNIVWCCFFRRTFDFNSNSDVSGNSMGSCRNGFLAWSTILWA